MKSIYLTQRDFKESILSDNIWHWKPIGLSDCRYPPHFQIHHNDSYVVYLMPRPGLKGLIGSLLGKDRTGRVVRGKEDGKWINLFSRFQLFFYEPVIALVKNTRLDYWDIKYYYWNQGITTAVLYKVKVESRVKPEKFANFLSHECNQYKIKKIIETELLKYLDRMRLQNHDTRCIIDGELHHDFLDEVGYTTTKFTLIYICELLLEKL